MKGAGGSDVAVLRPFQRTENAFPRRGRARKNRGRASAGGAERTGSKLGYVEQAVAAVAEELDAVPGEEITGCLSDASRVRKHARHSGHRRRWSWRIQRNAKSNAGKAVATWRKTAVDPGQRRPPCEHDGCRIDDREHQHELHGKKNPPWRTYAKSHAVAAARIIAKREGGGGRQCEASEQQRKDEILGGLERQPRHLDLIEALGEAIAGFCHDADAAARRGKGELRMRATTKPFAWGGSCARERWSSKSTPHLSCQSPFVIRQNAGDRSGLAVDAGGASHKVRVAVVPGAPGSLAEDDAWSVGRARVARKRELQAPGKGCCWRGRRRWSLRWCGICTFLTATRYQAI